MENSWLRQPFSDATHEEAKQYVKSSALIVLKLPAINSLCPRVMVLSCFRPRGYGNTGLFRPFCPASLSPSTVLTIALLPFNHFPSFLPLSSLQFFLLIPLRYVFAIDIAATSSRRSISRFFECERFKREIKFILFIHSRGCQFSFLLFPLLSSPLLSSFSLSLSLSLSRTRTRTHARTHTPHTHTHTHTHIYTHTHTYTHTNTHTHILRSR